MSQALFSIIKKNFPNDYAPEAYQFLLEALEYTVSKLPEKRHVSGRELSEGIRDYAKDSFGPMVLTVFNQWGLYKTDDFGEIVFRLISIGLMSKSDSDKKSDFSNLFEFKEVFLNANV